MSDPSLVFLAVLGAILAVVAVAFVLGLLLEELEWRIRARRARRVRGQSVDLTGVRP